MVLTPQVCNVASQMQEAGVWCRIRQQSLWLQSEWDFILSDTTKNVHLQVVYIFIEACCSTKKPMTKAKLHFQLLFSQPKKVNKTNFLTFKHGSKHSVSTIEILKSYEYHLLWQFTAKTKEIHCRLCCNISPHIENKKILQPTLSDEVNFHFSGHITAVTLKCG